MVVQPHDWDDHSGVTLTATLVNMGVGLVADIDSKSWLTHQHGCSVYSYMFFEL